MDYPRSVLKVRQAIRAHLDPGQHVIVACSGGADSLALVHGLAWEAREAGVTCSAIIVDHQIQEGSAEHSAQVADSVGKIMEATVVAVEIDDVGGPEGGARTARYRAITDYATQFARPLVLLGHTADDQAETVLLGLSRGSGPRSIAGMTPTGHIGQTGIPFARPFLGLYKQDITRALTSWKQDWWEDPTNEIDGPWTSADGQPLRRSALRHRAIPVLSDSIGSDVRPALVRTAELLQTDLDFIDSLAAEARERCVDGDRLNRSELARLHPALGNRVLRTWLLEVGARPGSLTKAHLDSVMGLSGNQVAHLPGVVVANSGGWLTGVVG